MYKSFVSKTMLFIRIVRAGGGVTTMPTWVPVGRAPVATWCITSTTLAMDCAADGISAMAYTFLSESVSSFLFIRFSNSISSFMVWIPFSKLWVSDLIQN